MKINGSDNTIACSHSNHFVKVKESNTCNKWRNKKETEIWRKIK